MNYNDENKITQIIDTKKDPNIYDFFNQKSSFIIYGAGQTGKRVLSFLKRHNIRVSCFLDQSGDSNSFIEDIPVRKPDNPTIDKNAIVIIALFNNITDVISVYKLLKNLGYTKCIPYTKLFLHFPDEFPLHYWLGPTDIYRTNISKIIEVFNILEDSHSRNLLMSIMKFRITGDPNCMPQPSFEDIYFPSNIPEVKKPEHFIDCGAFEGDTLELIRKKFGSLTTIRAFEPDLENFLKLVEKSNELSFSKDTVLFPCGVWSSTIQLNFTSEGLPSSRYIPEGKTTIQCVTLDECLLGYTPSLIKKDIEGSELEALEGCKKMIKSKRPDLAISIYHMPDHLWKIPLFIRELTPGYKYYLRSHGANGYDSVFYAYRTE